MALNLYERLKAILPQRLVYVVKVLTVYSDDTSQVELPFNIGQTPIADGVSTGQILRVRGASVPAGSYAFVRDGVIETKAPSGVPYEVVIGVIAAEPFGPDPLTFSGTIPSPSAPRNTAYSLPLASFVTGGYKKILFGLTGPLPPGLVFDTSTAILSGTPTTAGTYSLFLNATDTTRKTVTSNTFVITIT